MTDSQAPLSNTAAGSAIRFGAASVVDPYGEQARFGAASAERLAAGFACPLTDFGLLRFGGPDSLRFLHSQLTNDFEHLAADESRRFGYCTPKGRLVATLLGWRGDEEASLVVSRALAEPVRKRLAMYVLRAKVSIEDRSEAVALLGIGGAGAAPAIESLGIAAPGPMRVSRHGQRIVTGLPEVAVEGFAVRRWMLCVPASDVQDVWQELLRNLVAASTQLWRWTEVRTGAPRIVEATRERFVPQMVNLDLVGGLSFSKGCYPGQEVVARSQYLGKLKRRMFAAHLPATEPAPGSDVLAGAGGEPAGLVVMAAPSPLGGVDLLYEARVESVEAGSLSAGGEQLSPLTLPYTVQAQD